MSMRWHGDKVNRMLTTKLGDQLDDAALQLTAAVKAAVGTPGPPRSEPYHPPHMDTTELYHSYDHVTDKAALKATVGSDSPHSAWMELGTSTVLPRPHLLPTAVNEADDLARTIGQS